MIYYAGFHRRSFSGVAGVEARRCAGLWSRCAAKAMSDGPGSDPRPLRTAQAAPKGGPELPRAPEGLGNTTRAEIQEAGVWEALKSSDVDVDVDIDI